MEETGATSRRAGNSVGRAQERPRTAVEWDEFINRYIVGDFDHHNFAGPSSSPSPPLAELAEQLRQAGGHTPANELVAQQRKSGTDSRTSNSAASSNSHPASTILTVPTIVSRPFVTATEVTTDTEYNDYHPDLSSAGPSNQDPAIPNVPPDELFPDDTAREEERRRQFNESRRRQHQEQEDHRMTRAHLEQLEKDQEEAQVDADDEDGGTGWRRESKEGRRRRLQKAQLARAGKAFSHMSSDDDDNPLGSPGRRRFPAQRSMTSYKSTRSHSPSESVIPSVFTNSMGAVLVESGTNTTPSASHPDLTYNHVAERQRICEFYEAHGFMPAPKQTPDALRRRLRVIRRLGLEKPDEYHKQTLNRFTRLAVSIFKSKVAVVSIIGREQQTFLSEIGLDQDSTDLETSFCCHTVLGSGEQCMIVPNAAKDWRFRNNPFTAAGQGPFQFYAGAPLRIGKGSKAAIIGSMCIIDDKPRSFNEAERQLFMDLADCVVSELELLYSRQASIESAKLHRISVDFVQRSLKNRPTERAGQSRPGGTGTTSSSSTGKFKEGADRHQSDEEIDVYDEACREIRVALDAYAVAVIDLSQFHLFYPAYQNSSTSGMSTGRAGSTCGPTNWSGSGTPGSRPKGAAPKPSTASMPTDNTVCYAKSSGSLRAKDTYSVSDPLAPSRSPQVLFIPSRPRNSKAPKQSGSDDLAVLGYSCANDGFAFNFTSSPATRKIISDFIASHVKSRRVWYTPDDSEGIARSITHLMPPGTETSMAMPVFGFDNQVAFAIAAGWTDPLYTYPAGAMQFVETIAGSLLASVMKEKLHLAERAQLNFAAAASHELRTPLHQINAAAALLRDSLRAAMGEPSSEEDLDPTAASASTSPRCPPPTPVKVSLEDQIEALAQLETIETNGLALGHILENIIDTLDIGRMSERLDGNGDLQPSVPATSGGRVSDFSAVLEGIIKDTVDLETKSRSVAGAKSLEDVEIILEVSPRVRGRWLMTDDAGPLARALGLIIHNACKFTDKGYVHVTVQDASPDAVLPAGYDNSIKMSTVLIDIKDSGRGMSAEFLDVEVLRPFSKADRFMPGTGLGLGLAQRIIEILGGKLAIASSLGKGTLVHVEIPLHLLNDNDFDQEGLDDNADLPPQPRSPVRQDGIYLAGFDSGDPGVRRVGRSLLRQLKLLFCRVVDNIRFASLIVLPEGSLTDEELAQLASSARPNVEIIYLASTTSHRASPRLAASASSAAASAAGCLSCIPTTRLFRPLCPSVVRRIKQPAERRPPQHENYVSPVVGGEGARWDDNGGRRGSISGPTDEGEELVPSPPHGPRAQISDDIDHDHLTSPAWTSSELSSGPPAPRSHSRAGNHKSSKSRMRDRTPRLDLREGASDPLMAVGTDEPNEDPRPGMKHLRSEMGGKGSGPLRVLVVEDNPVNRKILTTMLKRVACRFAEAGDGNDAVITFNAFHPDLVLLDINMPIKDGFQAAAEMREIEHAQGRRSARIIAVTALSGETHRRKGIEASIDLWLVKPVRIKQLKEEVERMISGTGEEDEEDT